MSNQSKSQADSEADMRSGGSLQTRGAEQARPEQDTRSGGSLQVKSGSKKTTPAGEEGVAKTEPPEAAEVSGDDTESK